MDSSGGAQMGIQRTGKVFGGAVNMAAIKAQDLSSELALKEAQSQAKAIETSAAQREADRKEALARALASQNAMAGAKGVTLQGSTSDVMGADIEAAKQAQERDKFQTDLNKNVMLNRAYLQRKMDKGAKSMSVMQNISQSFLG